MSQSISLQYLTKASHAPAPFISAFILVHLSAPIVSNLGGASLSSSVMLLGREYYQGSPKELLLLFGPLGLHVSASILKRLLLPYPRPMRSLLSTAGYAALALLPTHILVHRVFPTNPSPPIYSIGPAQLDFSFIQHTLQRFPTRSLLMYSSLTVATIIHMLEGASLLYDIYYRAQDGEAKRWETSRVRTRRIIGSVAGLAIMGGLYALWSEPINMPLPSLLARFDAILSKSVLYRL